MVWILVSAFSFLGLLAIGLAFGVRRRSADRGDGPQSNKLLYTVLALVTVVIGLAIPAVLLIDNGENRDAQAVGGVDLTEAQVHGREMFATNCSSCHTLQASNATGAMGPNLDALRPPEGLVLNAILVGRARGAGNMPAELLTGEDAKDVASYVAAVAGRGEGLVTEKADEPATTEAGGGDAAAGGGGTQANAEGAQVFTQNCASCHTLKAAGATGAIGPNLDSTKPAEPLVVDRVTNGKGAMPAFKGQLTPAQIKAVSEYVATSAGK